MSNLKYTSAVLENAVKVNISYLGVLRTLNAPLTSGAARTHIVNQIKSLRIDTSHFLGLRANSGERHIGGSEKSPPEKILVLNRAGVRTRTYMLRRALLESGIKYQCANCEIRSWNKRTLILHIDHKNGNPLDNRIHNLRFLCPNCHSQRKNFCSPKYQLPRSINL